MFPLLGSTVSSHLFAAASSNSCVKKPGIPSAAAVELAALASTKACSFVPKSSTPAAGAPSYLCGT